MDTNLILRSGSSNLTADETLTSVRVGPMMRPMELMVLVPSITGGADTLDVELEFCATATPTTEISNMNMKQITAAGLYSIPFFTHHEYLQVKLNVTDVGGSGFSAGAVKVWIAPVHRYDAPYNA
jgi:hypothetical protein